MMIFDDCEELRNSSIDIWRNITETFVSVEVKKHAERKRKRDGNNKKAR